MKMRTVLMITLMATGMALAAPSPHLIPFQGRLTNQSGVPYTNGTYSIVFNMYSAPVGGSTLWTERHQAVGVINGMINVFLGSIEPFDPDTPNPDFSETVYLGITIDADNIPTSPDPEMVPRQMIIPAFQAKNAELLDGHDFSAILETGDDPTAANILASKIQIDGITAGQIGTGAVTSDEILNETIQSGDIKDGTIDELDLTADLQFRLTDGLIPAGVIVPFAGSTNNIPEGWRLCNGDVVTSNEVPRLFLAIGESWGNGGDANPLTINLPDMRGYFLRGVDHATGNDPDANSRTNYNGGAVGDAVGSVQEDDFESHNHTYSDWYGFANGTGSDINAGNSTHKTRNTSTGLRGGNETRPKNVYVNYIIKY